ncbi:MAG: glycosyltransferase [Breznakibacter sp.]
MHIILYESSSHGGCYKYAIELYHAYRQHPEVASVTLLLPLNATFDGEGVKKVLVPDNKPGSRIHFLYRHFVNPLRLLWHVKKAERCQEIKNLNLQTSHSETQAHRHSDSSSFILLNDFEQMSAPLWSPLFRVFLRKHKTGVFLHDADRDAYPPSPQISSWCMKQMMHSMDLGLHHGNLPQRPYYTANGKTCYLRVEHGLYQLPPPEKDMLETVNAFTAPFQLALGIVGHIREEKNYRLVMQVLEQHPHLCLVVAGSAANSQMDVQSLKNMASKLGIGDRVMWIDRYLSEPEMTAVIGSIDWVLLYYASSFHAQSGILNQTTPLRKPVLVSDLPNALTETVVNYQLGIKCKADDANALSKAFTRLETEKFTPQWDTFFADVDWNKQTNKVIGSFNQRQK